MSTRIGQSDGSPTGVMPPYSMPVCATASSIAAKEILRTSRCLRTVLFTSARSLASTRQAAIVVVSARRPATTTQFADASGLTSYAAQKAAVSAREGSISLTYRPTAPESTIAATGAASRSGRSAAGCQVRVPMLGAVTPVTLASPPEGDDEHDQADRGGNQHQGPTAPVRGRLARDRPFDGRTADDLGDAWLR